MKYVLFGAVALLLVLTAVVFLEPGQAVLASLRGEHVYSGRTANAWRQALLNPAPGVQTNTRKQLADGKAAAVPLLIVFLKEQGDPQATTLRRQAAMALGDMGSEAGDAVAELTQALDDADSHVRLCAADALGKIGPLAAEAVPRLAALLETDEPVRLLKALRRLRGHNAAALEPVRRILDHEDPEARENASECLGEMGPIAAPAVPRLTEMSKNDPNAKVRQEAAAALARIVPTEKKTPTGSP